MALLFRSRLVSLFYFETYGDDIMAQVRSLLHQWTANHMHQTTLTAHY